ncbi:MAG TPA: family 16 glycoside hydrolase [Chloroflexia bacterium]|nr:family 16 glycoside hydrolase [Chloroflexia bacterium]
MSIKKVIPVAALLLIVVGAFALAGAQQAPGSGVRVPPGDIVESPNARNGSMDNPRQQVPQAPVLPPATGPVVFSADFSQATLDAWRPLVSTSLGAMPSTWVAKDGRLHQRGDAQGEVSNDAATLLVKDVTFSDGTLDAQVYPTSGEPVGLVLRGSDAGYYRLNLYPNLPNASSKASIERVTPTGTTVVGEVPASSYAGFSYEAWNIVSISVQGSHFTVSVNGTQILDVTDTSASKTIQSGWVGVWTMSDMGAQFDNVRVQQAAGR